jgi:unsaturated chondroitin disaccharide hydrolase
MWKQAIEDALRKTQVNIERFGELFPHVSENDVYDLNPNNDWTDGFWSGILGP